MRRAAEQTHADSSGGDVNYGIIAAGYAHYRQPEPRIAALIHTALGDAQEVLNVGAGPGSYEPLGRDVIAVEPSASMCAQRPSGLPTAIQAVAEKLPFPDASFDACMATFTIHQWQDLRAGLVELRRVTCGPIVILTCDPAKVEAFWLAYYAPKVLAAEARRYPTIDLIAEVLGPLDVQPVPIPLNCRDGFNEAYYGRPERLLENGARLACSAWSFVKPPVVQAYVEHLARDLRDGTWDGRHGHLRTQPIFEGSSRLLVASGRPSPQVRDRA